MKRWLCGLLAAVMCMTTVPAVVLAEDGTEPSYIGYEDFDYTSADQLTAENGFTIDNPSDAAAFTMEDGKVSILHPAQTTASVTLTKQLNLSPNANDAYKTGRYRGHFTFTQVNQGNSYIRVHSSEVANGPLYMEQFAAGDLGIRYRESMNAYRTGAENKNGSFKVDYLIDTDTNRFSAWVTDISDPSSRELVVDDQTYFDAKAENKNCTGIDIILKGGDAGSGIIVDGIRLAYEDDYDVLETAAGLEQSILGENAGLDQISQNLVLDTAGFGGASVQWTSGNEEVIAPDGAIHPQAEPQEVLLTAEITAGDKALTKTVAVTVLADGGAEPGETEPAYIGCEEFSYDSAEALLASEGLTIEDTAGVANVTMQNGQVSIVHPKAVSAGLVTLTKQLNTAPEAGQQYKTGRYRGHYVFTQVGLGNIYIRLRSSEIPNPVFYTEIFNNGAFGVAFDAGKMNIYQTEAQNKNKTFCVEYLVDTDKNQISVWITDTADPNTRALMVDAQPYRDAAANGKNCTALDLILKPGAKNSGVLLDSVALAREDEYDLLETARTLETSILGNNASLYRVHENLALSTAGLGDTAIAWSSSNPAAAAADGTVTMTDAEQRAELTAVLTNGRKTLTRTFPVTILPVGDARLTDIVMLDTDTMAGVLEIGNAAVDTAETNLYDFSARGEASSTTSLSRLVTPDVHADITGYKYLNLWMHSAGEPGQILGLAVMDQNAKVATSIRYNSTGTPETPVGLTVDWTDAPGDWHLISLPLSDFVTFGDFNPTDVTRMWITYKNYGGTFQEGAAFNFDKVWFSIDSPDKERAAQAEKLLKINKLLGTNTAADQITGNLSLPTEIDGVAIRWISSDSKTIAEDGTVTRLSEQKSVSLTAELSCGEARIQSAPFAFTVLPVTDAELLIEAVKAMLTPERFLAPGQTAERLTADLLELPSVLESVDIAWTTDNPAAMTAAGKIFRSNQDAVVQLTANLSKDGMTGSKDLDFTIPAMTAEELFALAKTHLTVEDLLGEGQRADQLTTDLPALPAHVRGIADVLSVTWTSDKPEVLSPEGKVKRGSAAQAVTLTATFSITGEAGKETADFSFTVPPVSDEEILNQAAAALDYASLLRDGQVKDQIVSDLRTPPAALEAYPGVEITWSSDQEALRPDGTVVRGIKDVTAVLTATLRYGAASTQKDFTFIIKMLEREDVVMLATDGESANSSLTGAAAETEETNLYAQSMLVKPSAAVKKFDTVPNVPAVDVTGYQYLNFWIHSGGAPGGRMGILILDSTASTKRAASYSHTDGQKAYPMEFSDAPGEWHIISLPLSQFNQMDWGDVRNVRLSFNSSGSSMVDGMSYHIDRIWFSTSRPEEVEVPRIEARYIGRETFDYPDRAALAKGSGIVIDDTLADGTSPVDITMEDGQVSVIHNDNGTKGNVTITKLFDSDPTAYKTGKYKGEFTFTQVKLGNSYIRVRSSEIPNPVFYTEQFNNGELGAAYRDAASKPLMNTFRTGNKANRNAAFKVEYVVNADEKRVSVWITDVSDPSSRELVVDNQLYRDALADGKNCAGIDFILKTGPKGSGIRIDSAKLSYEADFDVLDAADQITLEALLNGNESDRAVKTDLAMPGEGLHGAQIQWESSDPAVIEPNGTVHVTPEPTNVTVTATVVRNGRYVRLVFPLVVSQRALTDLEMIQLAMESLDYSDLLNEGQKADGLDGSLRALPQTVEGIPVTWSSSNPDRISVTGAVTLGNEAETVTLTAVFRLNDAEASKDFTFTVSARDKSILYKRTFEDEDLSDWNFYDLPGGTSTHEVVDNQLVLTKTSAPQAVSTGDGVINADLTFKAMLEPYDETKRTAVYATAVDGVYEVETKITPRITAIFGITNLLGSNTMLPGSQCAYVFYKPDIVQAYVIVANKGFYYDLLPGSTYNRTYVMKYKVDTNKKRFWTYLDGNQVGDPEGYELGSTVNFITGFKLCIKSQCKLNDQLILDYVLLREIEANENSNTQAIQAAMEQLPITGLTADPAAVSQDLNPLPAAVGDAEVVWSSSRPELIADDGTLLKQPVDADADVVLTGAFTSGAYTRYKEYHLTVEANPSVRGMLMDAASAITAGDLTDEPLDAVTKSLKPLPAEGLHGTSITWTSDQPEYLASDGTFIRRDQYLNTRVNLTAVFTLEGESYEKVFALTIPMDTLAGMYTSYAADFSARPSDSWTYGEDGGTVQAQGGKLVLDKTGDKGAVQARVDLARGENDAIAVTKPVIAETELAVESLSKKADYTIYGSNGAPAMNLNLEYDEGSGFMVYYLTYNDNDKVDRGASYATTRYTARTRLEPGQNLKVKALIYPDTNRMSVWINDVLTVDNQFTRKAIENVQYAIFTIPDGEGGTGRLDVSRFTVQMNKGQVLELLMDNILYDAGFTDGGTVTGDLELTEKSVMGTAVSWQSSRPDIIAPDGRFQTPKEPTPVTLAMRLYHTDDPGVFLEKQYHVVAMNTAGGNLAAGKTVTTNAEGALSYLAANAVDGNMDTYWRTMGAEAAPYLTVDMGENCYIDGFALYEAKVNNTYPVTGYVLEGSLDNSSWKVLYSGGTIGAGTGRVDIPMSKARYVRYRVTAKAEGNTGLRELELYFEPTAQELIQAELGLLEIDAPYRLTESITLPQTGIYGSAITYRASHPQYLSETGKVNRPTRDVKVTLTPWIGSAEGEPRAFIVAGTGETGGNSGGGGGGHGGGGGAVSGGDSPFVALPETPEPPIDPNAVFADLSEGHWAYGYIKTLKERGIVSGDGTGMFHPEDSVTREEFLKMLLTAYGAETGGNAEMFDDVDAGAWYAPYVAAGVSLGVVKGVSEDSFGTGMPITRADMAVLCVRMMEQTGRWLEARKQAADFTDQDEIADYALDAVRQMRQFGVISGYEDGSFGPQKPATRAETAKMISMLL